MQVQLTEACAAAIAFISYLQLRGVRQFTLDISWKCALVPCSEYSARDEFHYSAHAIMPPFAYPRSTEVHHCKVFSDEQLSFRHQRVAHSNVPARRQVHASQEFTFADLPQG